MLSYYLILGFQFLQIETLPSLIQLGAAGGILAGAILAWKANSEMAKMNSQDHMREVTYLHDRLREVDQARSEQSARLLEISEKQAQLNAEIGIYMKASVDALTHISRSFKEKA